MSRHTLQRQAIQTTFEKASRPMSIQEIEHKANLNYRPSIGRTSPIGTATIYRNVKSMLEEGSIKEVDALGATKSYCINSLKIPNEMYQIGTSIYFEAPNGFKEEERVTIITGIIRK
jgi:Fe2+ or Zn2+ uptake regulation protein